jgi:hypothetical protein
MQQVIAMKADHDGYAFSQHRECHSEHFWFGVLGQPQKERAVSPKCTV